MTTKKKIIIGVILCFILAALIAEISFTRVAEADAESAITPTEVEKVTSALTSETWEVKWPEQVFKQEGYDNFPDWWEAVKSTRNAFKGSTDAAKEELGGYLSEEDIAKLQEYENEIVNSISLNEMADFKAKFAEIVDAAKAAKQQSYTYSSSSGSSSGSSGGNYSNGSGLTKSGGVNYYNGRKETWYSSNVLYHYRTPEWTAGSDGVYRTSDGYVVVAASDLPQGSLVETSFGTGKVLDSGCAAGTTDIYVNW